MWHMTVFGARRSMLLSYYLWNRTLQKWWEKTHRKSGKWNLLIFKVKLKFSAHKHDRYANIQISNLIFEYLWWMHFWIKLPKFFDTIFILEFPMEESVFGVRCSVFGWQKLIIFILSSIFLLLVYFSSPEAKGQWCWMMWWWTQMVFC